MQNANRWLVVLTIAMSVAPLAVMSKSFNEMDVKGFYLGQNTSSNEGFLNNCTRREIKYSELSPAPYSYMYDCGIRDAQYGFEYFVAFDHEKNLYNLRRFIRFSVKPDFDAIKSQLIDKYGDPDKRGEVVAGRAQSKPGTVNFYMCWGGCKYERVSDEYWKGTRVMHTWDGPSLLISNNWDHITGKYYLHFKLWDPSADKRAEIWGKQNFEKHEKKLRNKESSLDL